jgi:hypothetical protein
VNGKKAHRMESKPDRGVNLIKVHYMVIWGFLYFHMNFKTVFLYFWRITLGF